MVQNLYLKWKISGNTNFEQELTKGSLGYLKDLSRKRLKYKRLQLWVRSSGKNKEFSSGIKQQNNLVYSAVIVY